MDKADTLRKKLSYSLGANLISLLISIFTSIAIPGFLANDIVGYGYYQIFIFYVGYIGFLHFGLCDGIMLRVAGKNYQDLDINVYSGVFYILLAVEATIGFFIAVVSLVILSDKNTIFICCMIAVNIIVIIPKYMLSYLLQATSRVKEHAILTVGGRIYFGIAVALVILLGFRKFEYFIFVQTSSEIVSLILACWFCRNILLSKMAPIAPIIQECRTNISIGCQLLVSNLAALLITGIGRLGIQWKYDAYIYGETSFTFMTVNLMMSFISATEAVLYPDFKRKPIDEIKKIYSAIENKLMLTIFGGLVLFYPAKEIIKWMLPQYANAIQYTVYLIPMCIFSSKMSLLVQNYMKIFCMEKQIMIVNIITVIITASLTACSLLLSDSLIWIMISISIAVVLRCCIAEYLLKKNHCFEPYNCIYDIGVAIAFITCTTIIDNCLSTIVYSVIYLGYIVLRRKTTVNNFK